MNFSRKLFATLALVFLLLPITVFAGAVTYDADTTVAFTVGNCTIKNGSQGNSMDVNGNTLTLNQTTGDAFTINCPSTIQLTSSPAVGETCEADGTRTYRITSGVASLNTSFTAATVSTACGSGGGGGGGDPTPTPSPSPPSSPSPSPPTTPTTPTVEDPTAGEGEVEVMPKVFMFEDLMDFEMLIAHWGITYIRTVFDAGIMTGRGDLDGNKTFAANEPMNRAELAKVAVDTMGESPVVTSGSPFPDVSDISAWYFGYVKAGKSLGLFTGNADGTYMPAKNITRAEVAVVFSRMTKSTLPACDGTLFTDVACTHFGGQYITLMKTLGFMQGDVDATGKAKGTFRPDDNMTRAEIAVMVSKYLTWSK